MPSSPSTILSQTQTVNSPCPLTCSPLSNLCSLESNHAPIFLVVHRHHHSRSADLSAGLSSAARTRRPGLRPQPQPWNVDLGLCFLADRLAGYLTEYRRRLAACVGGAGGAGRLG